MSAGRPELPEPVNLRDKFGLISDYWSPKIVGELNDSLVKAVKLKGEFIWHYYEAEDELSSLSRVGFASNSGRAPGHQPWRIHYRASRPGTLPPHPDWIPASRVSDACQKELSVSEGFRALFSGIPEGAEGQAMALEQAVESVLSSET